MWHPWIGKNARETEALRRQTAQNQLLVACQGHSLCQRSYRSITCRSFPFFPYIDPDGSFLGLSYYYEYEDRCWVISNLCKVEPDYREQFIRTYEKLFEVMPGEKETFSYHSAVLRRVFGRKHRRIPLLHRNGFTYKLSPRTGKLRRVRVEDLPKFGPYKIAAMLPFPGETG
jgi:hypothetical protein